MQLATRVAAALRDEEIDLVAGVITITGKGDRQRRVYLADPDIRDLLVEYISARDARGHSGPPFLVNSRGGAASPQFVRRLNRTSENMWPSLGG